MTSSNGGGAASYPSIPDKIGVWGAPKSGQGDQICCEYLSTENRNYTAQAPLVLRNKNHLGSESPAKTLDFEITSAPRVVKKARRHFSR
jgi:hypothetical protein